MSEVINGTVNLITAYNAKFKNAGVKISGHEEWFRASQEQAEQLSKGSKVALKVKQKDNGDYQILAVKVPGKAAPAAAKGRTAYAGGAGNDVRGPAIQYQHSQEMAILTAELILAQGGFKLGAANKPEERGKQVLGLIDSLTSKFYTEIETLAAVKKAKAQKAEAADDDAPEAESEEDSDEESDDPAWDDE
jgi:hypothetical protein